MGRLSYLCGAKKVFTNKSFDVPHTSNSFICLQYMTSNFKVKGQFSRFLRKWIVLIIIIVSTDYHKEDWNRSQNNLKARLNLLSD